MPVMQPRMCDTHGPCVCVSDLLPNIGARGPSSAKQGKGAVHVTSARCEPVEPLLLLPWRAAGRRSRWCPVVPRRHRATLKPLPPRLHPSRPEQLVDCRRVEEQVKSTTLARVHRVGQSIGLAAWQCEKVHEFRLCQPALIQSDRTQQALVRSAHGPPSMADFADGGKR